MLNIIKRNIPKLVRFGVVGFLGTIINLTTYYAMTEIASIDFILGAILSFFIAVSSNYIFNHLWTFKVENGDKRPNVKQFSYYLLGNMVGLSVNIFILKSLITFAGVQFHLVWQLIGISSGMIFNFIFAKKIVFTIQKNF